MNESKLFAQATSCRIPIKPRLLHYPDFVFCKPLGHDDHPDFTHQISVTVCATHAHCAVAALITTLVEEKTEVVLGYLTPKGELISTGSEPIPVSDMFGKTNVCSTGTISHMLIQPPFGSKAPKEWKKVHSDEQLQILLPLCGVPRVTSFDYNTRRKLLQDLQSEHVKILTKHQREAFCKEMQSVCGEHSISSAEQQPYELAYIATTSHSNLLFYPLLLILSERL